MKGPKKGRLPADLSAEPPGEVRIPPDSAQTQRVLGNGEGVRGVILQSEITPCLTNTGCSSERTASSPGKTTTPPSRAAFTPRTAGREKLLHAKNEAYRLPTLNLTMARAYLSAHDAKMSTRTWMAVMREMGTHGIRTKQEGTEILRRWEAGCRSFECCTFTKRARPAKDVVESNVHG